MCAQAGPASQLSAIPERAIHVTTPYYVLSRDRHPLSIIATVCKYRHPTHQVPVSPVASSFTGSRGSRALFTLRVAVARSLGRLRTYILFFVTEDTLAACDNTLFAGRTTSYHSAQLVLYFPRLSIELCNLYSVSKRLFFNFISSSDDEEKKTTASGQRRTVALITSHLQTPRSPLENYSLPSQLTINRRPILVPTTFGTSTLSLENPSTYRPTHPPIHASLHSLSSLLSSGLRFCHFFSLSAFIHFVASRLLLVLYLTSLFYTAASATVAHLLSSSFTASAYTPDRTFGSSACKGRNV